MGLFMYRIMAELPKDVTKWSPDDVEVYLTSKIDGFTKDDIDLIWEKNVDGDAFLKLTEGILMTFKIEFVNAVKIMKLVNEKQGRKQFWIK